MISLKNKFRKKNILLALWFTLLAAFAAYLIIQLFSDELLREGRFEISQINVICIASVISTFFVVFFRGESFLKSKTLLKKIHFDVFVPILASILGTLFFGTFAIVYMAFRFEKYFHFEDILPALVSFSFVGILGFIIASWITVPISILGSIVAAKFINE